MDINVGDIFENNKQLKYKIIEIIEQPNTIRKYKIKFLNSGFERITYKSSIKKGMVKDNYEPIIFGVGCIGNAIQKDHKKEYRMWYNMMIRCYDINSRDYVGYGKVGVKVCKRWHCFENFLNDFSNIDGYDEKLFKTQSFALDKDKKQMDVPYNERIYSLETCTLLTPSENSKYRRTDNYKREFIAISPKGDEIYVKGLLDFCLKYSEYKLGAKEIGLCLEGKWKQHKGWKFKNI